MTPQVEVLHSASEDSVVHHSKMLLRMSAEGQERTFRIAGAMSGSPRKADIALYVYGYTPCLGRARTLPFIPRGYAVGE